ncbi:hypothetical protein GOP47_0023240 [Adiantum capillus-veneris]|uniref:Leucine-rich repeat-containing N-terminal plant-type domain-containing protein n=1 Tax=Adiantum capillus-veneris TaxID=13818 RepID=A0A9D4U988_ADICA|nr:hypothetical protein GOP47_0023240 [Adiantum capillus-veneris]
MAAKLAVALLTLFAHALLLISCMHRSCGATRTVAVPDCSASDIAALRHFAHSVRLNTSSASTGLAAAGWTDLFSSWMDGRSQCCSWKGVTCDVNVNGNETAPRVSRLHISAVDQPDAMAGPIPVSLCHLSALSTLSLSNSYLSGPIPPCLTSLPHLHHLDLHNNSLNASSFTFSSPFRSLRSLDLSQNILSRLNLNSTLLTFLPTAKLTSLDLSRNRLSGRLPPALCSFHRLSELSFNYNTLSGSIPECFFNLTALQLLHLAYNHLSGPLPQTHFRLPNLLFLSLSHNAFSGPLIMSSLFLNNLPALQFLGLHSNSLYGTLPESLFNLPALDTLYLSYNFLTGTLPKSLFNQLPALKVLRLSFNALSGPIPDSFFNLTEIAELSISGNVLSEPLPSLSTASLLSLKILDLSQNNLSGQLPSFSSLQFPALGLVRLNQNQFTGPISNSFCNLTSLITLDLRGNGLSGSYPTCLGLLPVLNTLYLSKNHFQGPIPDLWRTAMPTLKTLDLSGLQKQGSSASPLIPRWLFRSKVLESLYITSSNLHNIDINCSELSLLNRTLFSLDLSNNQLKGNHVWSCMANMSNLDSSRDDLTLNLSGNPLDVELHRLQPLAAPWSIDLSNCNLRGHLTNEFLKGAIGSQYYIVNPFYNIFSIISLANNNLEGNLPSDLPLVPYRIIDLSNNTFTKFQESILESKQTAQSLLRSVVKLSHNKLKGDFASFFNSYTRPTCTLQLLDVSHNELTGQLPSSLGTCSELRWLDVSYNKLEGQIPTEIGACENLEILSLRENFLSGSLPSFLPAAYYTLGLLDMSHNQLNGSVSSLFSIDTDDILLRVLLLSHNHLSGHLPPGWGAALQIIDLSYNELTGNIPTNIDLPGFEGLAPWEDGLSITSLSSDISISVTFQGLEYIYHPEYKPQIELTMKGSERTYPYVRKLLVSLDLSHNHLVGAIPSALGGLTRLVNLNLSSNRLTDNIPSELGNLDEQLQSLDLSNNSLEGLIPISALASLSKVEVFNVSFNPGLKGEILAGNPQLQNKDSYLGDPDVCGDIIQKPCKSDEAGGPPSTTTHHIESDQADAARPFIAWIHKWTEIPALCIGFALGFIPVFWIVVLRN